jgi:hypothetical protein
MQYSTMKLVDEILSPQNSLTKKTLLSTPGDPVWKLGYDNESCENEIYRAVATIIHSGSLSVDR